MSKKQEIGWFWGGLMLFFIAIHMGLIGGQLGRIEGQLGRIANALEAIAKAGQ